MDMNKAFTTALSFEKKGRQIYLEAAKKTKNQIVAKTFEYLAEQESNHINEIKGYVKEHKIELKGDTLEDTKRFFSMTVDEYQAKANLTNDDLKAHDAALELEQQSYDFYKEQHDNTDDAELKNFFRFLMGQENAHYALVQNAYNFIKNPEHFYAEEEKWTMEG